MTGASPYRPKTPFMPHPGSSRATFQNTNRSTIKFHYRFHPYAGQETGGVGGEFQISPEFTRLRIERLFMHRLIILIVHFDHDGFAYRSPRRRPLSQNPLCSPTTAEHIS